nr:hypothetical protein [Tanacetum cinerariifolium]
MAQQSFSYYGGPFNAENCPSCSIVGAGNEFVHDPNPFPYDNTPEFYDQPPQHHVETYSCELCENDSHYGYDCPPRFSLVYEQEPCYHQNFGNKLMQFLGEMILQQEHAANLSNHTPEPLRHVNSIYYDDDDDNDYKESTIPLNEIISQIPPSIESHKVIKSSVEDFVPIPSESEDTFGSDSEYDLPSCDDLSPINVPEGKSVTFSSPLFGSNDNFTSSDDESLSDEEVPEDNVKF